MSTALIVAVEAVALGILAFLFWLARRWITHHGNQHNETAEAIQEVSTQVRLMAQQNENDHNAVRETLRGVKSAVVEVAAEVAVVKGEVAEVRGAQAVIIGDYKRLPAFS